MATKEKDDLFNEDNAVPNNWITWGKQGDYIAGTLIAVREMTSKLPEKQGEKVPVYEIKADRGEFHKIDDDKKPIEPPITIEVGDIWNLGSKQMLDRQLRNVKLGTKIGIKFTETQPAARKGFSPLKVIKVYVQRGRDNKPVMDEEWLGERDNAEAVENF